MQIDLCVFLSGKHLEEYTPLFIETLFKNCDTSNLCIHVVERGYFDKMGPVIEDGKIAHWLQWDGHTWDMNDYHPVSERVHAYLLRKQEESKVPFHIYKKHDPREFFCNSRPGEPFFYMADDHANTLNWAMQYCGVNKWVIFCHSDMIFRSDIISLFMEEMNDWTGMFGLYSHCLAVNREAFFRVGFKFNSVSNFRAIPSPHNGFDLMIRHASDESCHPDSRIIYAWDVGQLLELMMIAYGWRCKVLENHPTWYPCIQHMASGHGYYNDILLVHSNPRSVFAIRTPRTR